MGTSYNSKRKRRIHNLLEQMPRTAPPGKKTYKDVRTKLDLLKALDTLSLRDRTVLKLTFGVDCDGEHTSEEIASKLDLTPTEAEEIKVRALATLANEVHDLRETYNAIQ